MDEDIFEEVAEAILNPGVIEIRDVDAGEPPFVYTSGNFGPVYAEIKELVCWSEELEYLTNQLAKEVANKYKKSFDFVSANAKGGNVPGWQFVKDLENTLGLRRGTIPFCYFDPKEKKATGMKHRIEKGMKGLIFDDVINYATNACTSVDWFRSNGFSIEEAVCILTYDNPFGKQELKKRNVNLTYLTSVPEVLEAARSGTWIPEERIDLFFEYTKDREKWQEERKSKIR